MAGRNPKDGTRNEEQQRDEGKAEFEKFDGLMTKLLAVPKEEVDEKRREEERIKQSTRSSRDRKKM